MLDKGNKHKEQEEVKRSFTVIQKVQPMGKL